MDIYKYRFKLSWLIKSKVYYDKIRKSKILISCLTRQVFFFWGGSLGDQQKATRQLTNYNIFFWQNYLSNQIPSIKL